VQQKQEEEEQQQEEQQEQQRDIQNSRDAKWNWGSRDRRSCCL
jgi:hypothetical protein